MTEALTYPPCNEPIKGSSPCLRYTQHKGDHRPTLRDPAKQAKRAASLADLKAKQAAKAVAKAEQAQEVINEGVLVMTVDKAERKAADVVVVTN